MNGARGRVRAWRQDSPIGPLFVAEGPAGVQRIEMRGDRAEALLHMEAAVGDFELLDRPPRSGTAVELDQYFAGSRRAFRADVDLSSVGGFHRTVLETLVREVGYAELVSYGELADLSGRPRAARAVGQAMNRNPVPVLVPCHRVIASGGRIGGYGTGVDTKRRLLAIEGVVDLPD